MKFRVVWRQWWILRQYLLLWEGTRGAIWTLFSWTNGSLEDWFWLFALWYYYKVSEPSSVIGHNYQLAHHKPLWAWRLTSLPPWLILCVQKKPTRCPVCLSIYLSMKKNVLLMLSLTHWPNICLCRTAPIWQISLTGQTTDLTGTWLTKWTTLDWSDQQMALGTPCSLKGNGQSETPNLRLGPWILMGSFDLTNVWEHCWHMQSFPLNVTLSPIGKGLLKSVRKKK